ncbi:MBL fold metallo-hydrolase [Magnetococcus sp. PR-3]|uniref:MBL fold metallo-hydrolase n=1 Tax=Magnetococcus sp. PR-3 TaxID=3120355 RepID=UPI002FCE17CA
MPQLNYDRPIAITRDIHWVGFHDAEANLHCNPYLLIDDEDVVVFDPGSIPHFPIVTRKIIDLVKPQEITLIIAHHQDPDVCGNLPVIEDVIGRDDLRIAASLNTIRLIRHYGIKSKFHDTSQQGGKLSLRSGRELQFIPTPYLHAPGAIVTYDTKSRSLFSSDLFGAIDHNWALYAGDHFPQSMDSWHQQYMPSNTILAPAMARLSQLQIDRILPQHGSIIEGEQVKVAIEHLRQLPCGLDLKRD